MKIFYAVIFLLCFTFSLNAQLENGETDEKVIKKELVKMLKGPSNIGQDFWVSVPPPYLVADPQSFTRFFIASGTDCTVRISSESGIDISKFVKAGSTESFDLKPGECQPYVWQVGSRANPAQVYVGKGLNITSTAPIIVYVVVRYQYTSDGYLALPTQGLGTEYISSVYDSRPYNGNSLPNMLTIVAPYDRTKVDFYLGGNIETEVEILGGQRLRPGDTKRWTMNKGDVLVLSNYGDFQTLSGSYIKGDKPIAVISGQACTDVPVNTYACDYTVEMDIPIHSWGQVYNVPWVRVRRRPSVMRIFAKEPGTTVWRDGQQVAYFTDGCYLKGGGFQNAWLEQRIWPVGIDPNVACYTSDKPMYISIYNPGETDDQVSSDPFSIVITPIEQYQNEIIFCTPASGGGRNFSTNFCNVVIELDENNLIPGDLEFGKVNSDGTVDWEKVITKFGANYAPYYSPGTAGDATALEDSPHKGRKFGEKNILLPGDGVYAIRSNSLFAAYSYGFDSFDSYGFPTSTALRVISKDTVAPEISWTMDCNGNVEGTTTDLPDDETIRVGLSIPELQWDEIINFTDFTYDNNNFIPGTETTAWRISVDDPTKYAKVIVVFYDRSGNVSRDTIEYYPELIDLREVAVDDENGDLYNHNHGVVGLSENHIMRYEIENLSDSRTFSLTELKLKFKDQNFTIEPLGWNLTDPFGPREIRQFDILFNTDEEGRFQDSIGLATECNDKFYAVIQAETGIPGITVDDQAFPVQVLNPSGTNPPVTSQDRWIQNKCNGEDGTQPLVIIGYNDPVNPEFTHNLNTLTFPLTIQPGERVGFKVTFTANAIGNLSDEIVFITEQGELGCDPICKITAKVTEAGLLAQDHDWGKVRINYQTYDNIYSPVGSELITASNTSVLPDGAALTIQDIKFGQGPNNEVVNPLNAFSFQNDFAKSLPENPNNFFRSVSLAPEAKNKQRPVYFRPQAVGKYEIEYYFESTAEERDQETKYTISGHGVVPNMILYHNEAGTEVTDNVDFGTITAGVPAEAVTKTFFIQNRPDNTDNGDSLTITKINWSNEISTDLANTGGLPFAVDEQAILAAYGTAGDYPIVLKINEELQFDVVFYTEQANTPHTANITITSDADESGNTGVFNGDISLEGYAVRPSLDLETEPMYSCVSNPLVIDENYPGYENMFYAVNEGTKDVTVNRLYFEPVDGNNTGYTINVDGGIVIKGDGSANVNVNATSNSLENVVLSQDDKLVVLLTYIPTAKYDVNPKMIRMMADTDIENVEDQPTPEEFGCTSNSFTRGSKNIVLDKNGNVLNDDGTSIKNINFTIDEHRQLSYKVTLDEITKETDLSQAELKSVEIEVTFRRGFITYNNSLGVRLLGSYSNNANFNLVGPIDYENYEFVPEPSRDNKSKVMQTIKFRVEALGNNFFNDPGDLFEVVFNTGITNYPVEGINGTPLEQLYVEGRDDKGGKPLESTITTALVSGNSCGFINPPDRSITLALDEICAMGLRPLSLSDFTNSASLISPNPVTSSGASIEFSIAFDSETVVRIIDTKGEIVAVLNNSKLNAGEHTLNIPVEKLANGVYFYEIESTDLKVKDKFIVNK